MTDSEGEGLSRGTRVRLNHVLTNMPTSASISKDVLAVELNINKSDVSQFVREHVPALTELDDERFAIANLSADERLGVVSSKRRSGVYDDIAGKKKKHRRPLGKSAHSEPGKGQVGYLCIADEFQLAEMAQYYSKDRQNYNTNLFFDVLHITPKQHTKDGGATKERVVSFDLFLFDYGVVVWWGVNPRDYSIVENDFMLPSSRVNKFIVNRYKTPLIAANFPVWCTFSTDPRELTTDANEPDLLFEEELQYDHFLIRNNSSDVKLCISHALAQSAKIDYLEIKVTELMQNCKPLPRELKDKGSVTISERKLLQLRGEVLFYRLMLKSGSDLLDEPELFWQHPWLKPFYMITKDFFEITPRVGTLDAKLDATNEILSMISDQFNQRHGSRLEWIVIWLVMVEVIIGVLELILDVKPWAS